MTEHLVVMGRMALGGLFVIGGLSHFGNMATVAGLMTRHGVPLVQPLLVAGTLFQIVTGTLLMAGIAVHYAALGLVAFTVAATGMVLRFWELPQGSERHAATNAFLSNLGVVGGLLIAAAVHE